MLPLAFDIEMKEQSTIGTSSSSLSQNFSFLSEFSRLGVNGKSQKLSLGEAVLKKEEKVIARSRSTMKLMKRNLSKEAYLEQLRAAIDSAKEKLRNVGSQISASHVSTTHLMQLIDFADIVAGVKDVNEIVNARRGNERIIDHFKIEEEKHVEHCREQISEILSSWRMENRVSRLLYRIPPADLFERKVASIVARLLRCEETSQVSEKEINEKLETLLQRERELNEQFDDTNRAMAKVAVDIEVKKQRIHIFEERASKNRERKIELEKRIGNEERAVNSSQKQFHKNTSLLAELVHKKGDYEAQLSKYDMLIESYASKIGETRREDERLFQELTGLGIETSRSAMEKEVNEVRIKIDSLKEELAMLDASLGDERQKSVSEVKGELLKLKEAKAERTQELAEIRRLIAECKDKLLVVLKNAEAVNVELEKSRLALQKRLVEEMRKKRNALKAAATNNPKGSYAYHPADGGTLPAPGTVRLPSSVQNVDTAKGAEVSTKPKAELSSPRKEKSKVASVSDNGLLSPGPVKATTSQPMMANWHAEKSVGKLLRSDNAQESSPMSSKSVGASDLHDRICSWIQHRPMW